MKTTKVRKMRSQKFRCHDHQGLGHLSNECSHPKKDTSKNDMFEKANVVE